MPTKWIASGLLAVMAALMIGASRQDSATVDETTHLAAGYSYWLGYRYQSEPHCDLADQLTFYSSGRDGAGRRFNLDFYCKAFGIQSPKSHGVTGADINRLLAEGRSREIAEYCLRDVQATVLLYHIWRERLSGIK